MRVLVPYTRLHPETARRLARFAPDAVLRAIEIDDRTGYWRVLAEAWAWPGDLVVIEHDIGIDADVLPGFAACPEPVCARPYRWTSGDRLITGFGCVRFRAEVKQAHPELFTEVGELDWLLVEPRVGGELQRRVGRPHVHRPAVEHYGVKSDEQARRTRAEYHAAAAEHEPATGE
ncbi:MAG TPA: hypothetical protein VH373_05120 [Jatrophihabitantaceae bacterium]